MSDYIEKRKQVDEAVKAGFQQLSEALKQGKSERLLEYLDFTRRFHRYSANSQMLIWCQKPQATLVAGYRRWQQLGQQVKRGEKGIAILVPMVFRTHTHDNDKDDQETAEIVTRFKVGYVFDVSQLAESETPLPDYWIPLPDDYDEQYQLVRRAIESAGIAVREGQLPFGVHGESRGGLIVLAEGRDSRSRLLTLIHEWAHELMHKGEHSSTTRQEKEHQAEAVAYVVAKHLGLDSPFSADYLLSYGATPETLMAQLQAVQQTASDMIEQIENQTTGGQDDDDTQ